MDTQFHIAAFDHLSQLVGGRKRSEQRRRVAIFGTLALLTLLASLALGARDRIRLNEEVRRERGARQAAEQDARDEAEERHGDCISRCKFNNGSDCENFCDLVLGGLDDGSQVFVAGLERQQARCIKYPFCNALP